MLRLYRQSRVWPHMLALHPTGSKQDRTERSDRLIKIRGHVVLLCSNHCALVTVNCRLCRNAGKLISPSSRGARRAAPNSPAHRGIRAALLRQPVRRQCLSRQCSCLLSCRQPTGHSRIRWPAGPLGCCRLTACIVLQLLPCRLLPRRRCCRHACRVRHDGQRRWQEVGGHRLT